MTDVLVQTEEIISYLEDGDGDLLVVPEEEVSFLSEAVQGPAGPAGANGSANFTRLAGVAISGQRVVAENSAGEIVYADATDLLKAHRTVGVSKTAASQGAQLEIVAFGEFEESGWNWTPNEPLFFDANGFLRQTPFPGAAFIQKVGHALTPTRIFLNLDTPILVQ
jgi:hypothetical protein